MNGARFSREPFAASSRVSGAPPAGLRAIAQLGPSKPAPAYPRVLALGVEPALLWWVTHCLARARMRPVVLGARRISPLAWSSECTYLPLRNLSYRNGELDPRLLDQVDKTCRTFQLDCVMPADFPSVMLLARHGARLRAARVVAVPDAGTIFALHNKWLFSRAIARLGLPQPQTEIASTVEGLTETRLQFPLVTKPVDGSGGRGFQVHKTRRALLECLAGGGLRAPFPVLVQEYIAGRDVGFAFLARHGELVAHAAFAQERRGARRHFQAPELRRYVAKLARETRYHGVGQVDARYDPQIGEYKLLELNPRFWTSLPYQERAGMNFPELLVRLDQLSDAVGCSAHPEPVELTRHERNVARSIAWSEWLQRGR